jgi:hypothetical protein
MSLQMLSSECQFCTEHNLHIAVLSYYDFIAGDIHILYSIRQEKCAFSENYSVLKSQPVKDPGIYRSVFKLC